MLADHPGALVAGLPRRTRAAGYTLLEITVALGVFGILVAGAFGLAAGSIELTREMSEFETRELARMRFLQLCRATFRELPGTARFRLLEVDAPGSGGASQVLCVSGHPRAFPVGLASVSGESVAGILPEIVLLSTRPDGAGGLMIRLHHLTGEEAMRFDEDPSLEGLRGEPLSLLRGIRQVKWRFYDVDGEQWVEIWDQEERRPRFAELTLQLHGDQRPYRSVFWLPDAHLPGDFQPPPAAPGPSGEGPSIEMPEVEPTPEPEPAPEVPGQDAEP